MEAPLLSVKDPGGQDSQVAERKAFLRGHSTLGTHNYKGNSSINRNYVINQQKYSARPRFTALRGKYHPFHPFFQLSTGFQALNDL